MKRRTFLGLLGLAPAAGPLAAKAALDSEIGSLTGTDIWRPNVNYSRAEVHNWEAEQPTMEDRVSAAQKYIATVGIPDFVDAQLRAESKKVYGLDPDIAAKRSWSMSVKIQEQRERNYKRSVEIMTGSFNRCLKQNAFKQITGISWPWRDW